MMRMPMCADFYPHAEVTSKFGILREAAPVPGICERAVFIVDKDGKLIFAKTYPLDQLPNMEEVMETLRRVSTR